METWVWIVIAIVAAAVILALAGLWAWSTRRRSARLHERFGPEYDRAVSGSGRRDGERRLAEIGREHDELEIRPLSDAARERYLEEWRAVEARFVDEPEDAARGAERIVLRALEERGYPMEREQDRTVHLAVDHPDVVERYRHGSAMLGELDGPEGTENLRKAMLDFRAVFEEIVEGQRTAA